MGQEQDPELLENGAPALPRPSVRGSPALLASHPRGEAQTLLMGAQLSHSSENPHPQPILETAAAPAPFSLLPQPFTARVRATVPKAALERSSVAVTRD